MNKKLLFSLSIFALGAVSVSAYSLNIDATGNGVDINGLKIESTGSGASISTDNSDLDINTNTQQKTSELNITGTTNNTLNITGGTTGGSNTGSVQIQADPRDTYEDYRDAYQEVRDAYQVERDTYQEYRDAAQDFRDGNLKVSENKDGSVTLKSQNGALMITADEDGGTSELKISGTPSKLSIIAKDPETRGLTLSAVANMKGDSHLLIQDDSDLQVYSDYVIEAQPKVKKVTYGNNTVEISYKQDARFLGIFGSYLNGRIIADSISGDVVVKLPWYSFLFAKDGEPNELTLSSKVSDELNNDKTLNISSGGNTLQIGAQRNAKTTGLIISAF